MLNLKQEKSWTTENVFRSVTEKQKMLDKPEIMASNL